VRGLLGYIAFSFLLPSASLAADPAQFTGLGSLFAGGSSGANAVSADGTAVVGASSYFDPANPANNRSAGYLWTGSGDWSTWGASVRRAQVERTGIYKVP